MSGVVTNSDLPLKYITIGFFVVLYKFKVYKSKLFVSKLAIIRIFIA